MSKRERPLYHPPLARDLSDLCVRGDVSPMGWCYDGNVPSSLEDSCTDGGSPWDEGPGQCTPTGMDPECGNCWGGGSVHHECFDGSSVHVPFCGPGGDLFS